MRLRDRELLLEWPASPTGETGSDESWPLVEIGLWRTSLQCRPGAAAIAMCPPAARHGSLHLPDSTASRHRPDFGVVLSSGAKWLQPGDRVALRPYCGIHFSPFQMGTLPGGGVNFRVRSGVLAIRVDPAQESQSGILIGKAAAPQTGTVVSAHQNSDFYSGDRIIFSRQRSDTAQIGLDQTQHVHDQFEGVLLIPEGRIVARILGETPQCDYVRFLTGPRSLEDQICLIERNGGWLPAPGWVAIDTERQKTQISLPVRSANQNGMSRVRLASEVSNLKTGSLVCHNPDPNRILRMGLGAPETFQLIRESDLWMVIL